MDHELKIAPCYFHKIATRIKTFELRKNDRCYKDGDSLVLREYNGVLEKYTGNIITCDVPYVFLGGGLGLDKDYCILSISNIRVLNKK